jgi:hypothetical protein
LSPWVPRVLIALVLLGISIAIVSISVGTGGPQAVNIGGRPEVQGLIAGIRQDGPRLGDPDAPVTIEVFADLRSPASTDFELEVVDPLIEGPVRDGQLRLYLRHFSFAQSPVSQAAIAADAAARQGYEWQFAELVLRNLEGRQGAIDETFLKEVAEVTPGLDIDEWESDFADELGAQQDDPATASTPYEDGKLAFELKLPANPAVRLCGPGGVENLVETPTADEVSAAVSRVGVPPEGAEVVPSNCPPG